MATTTNSDEAARRVGRGALLIAVGKVVFLFAGATINFVLPRLLTKAEYGNYGVVVRVVSLLNMMTVIGLLQSVSKLVSERPGAARATLRRSTVIAGVTSASVALLFALCAPLLASALRDPGLLTPFAAAAVITAGYGVYAVAIGGVNGLERFRDQALLDIGFSICKVTCILLGAVLLGGLGHKLIGDALPVATQRLGATGAVAGFACAALLMAGLAHLALRHWTRDCGEESALQTALLARRLLLFAGAVMLYQGLLNALMSADLLLVKRHFAGEAAAAAGIYNGALNVAQLPYFGVLAITFVAFPLVSSSTFQEDRATTQRYLRTAFRYGSLIAVGVSVVVAANARDILALIFPQGYVEGAASLTLLVAGYTLLALHAIGCTILNAAGQPLRSAVATGLGFVVAAGVSYTMIPVQGLTGAALGPLVGGGVGLLLTVLLLHRHTGATPDALSALRVFGVGVVIALAGTALPARGALLAVPSAAATGLVFVALLILTRELGREDLRVMLAPFRRQGR